jgi:hypothetical protein
VREGNAGLLLDLRTKERRDRCVRPNSALLLDQDGQVLVSAGRHLRVRVAGAYAGHQQARRKPGCNKGGSAVPIKKTPEHF